LRGKQPKLKPNQAKHLLELHDSGNHTQAQLAGLFGVGRWATSRLGTPAKPRDHRAVLESTGRYHLAEYEVID
jgi:hypothetical protein